MKILSKVKIALAKLTGIEFEKTPTDKGVLVHDGDVIVKGDEVFVEDSDGNLSPAPDGEYKSENGDTTYIVAGGVVTEIAEGKEPPAKEELEDASGGEVEPASDPDEDKRIEELAGVLKDLVAYVEGLLSEVGLFKTELSKIKNDNEKFSKALDLPVDEPAQSKANPAGEGELSRASRFFSATKK